MGPISEVEGEVVDQPQDDRFSLRAGGCMASIPDRSEGEEHSDKPRVTPSLRAQREKVEHRPEEPPGEEQPLDEPQGAVQPRIEG